MPALSERRVAEHFHIEGLVDPVGSIAADTKMLRQAAGG
jgi:hypothetical protein